MPPISAPQNDPLMEQNRFPPQPAAPAYFSRHIVPLRPRATGCVARPIAGHSVQNSPPESLPWRLQTSYAKLRLSPLSLLSQSRLLPYFRSNLTSHQGSM